MPRNAECWGRLTTGHSVENKSVQTDQTVQTVQLVQSDQPVPGCVAKAATLLLPATLSRCAANHLATAHWVENKSVQSDQPVTRCNGKAVTLGSMRLATVTAERFRGAPLRTILMVAGSPAQRDEIPIPPSGRGTGRPIRRFFAFSLRLVAGICFAESRRPRAESCLSWLVACGLLLFSPPGFGGHGNQAPHPAISRHIPRYPAISRD
jgi:hypothetical protein